MIRMMLMIILITVSATQMRSPSPSRRSRLVQLNPPTTASQGYRPSCDAAVCGVLAPVTIELALEPTLALLQDVGTALIIRAPTFFKRDPASVEEASDRRSADGHVAPGQPHRKFC